MSVELAWIAARLNRRLNEADRHFSGLLARDRGYTFSHADLFELEGWLSTVWQSWGRFCRNTVVASCCGCQTTSGIVVPATHTSAGTVSYIAWKQCRGTAPKSSGTNGLLRNEPTWGHIDKLLDVITALNPFNYGTISGGFGTVPAIDHVRIIRNAAAHRNVQTAAEVIGLQTQYIGGPLRNPLEALFWIDPTTGRTLAQVRMEDMRIGARNVCI